MFGRGGRKEDPVKSLIDDTQATLSGIRECARMIAMRTRDEVVIEELGKILAYAERAKDYQRALRDMADLLRKSEH